MLLPIVIIFFVSTYIIFSILLQKGWRSVKETIVPDSFTPQTSVTIIVPVRNEENSIGDLLKGLLNQNYPESLMKVFLVDDQSTDGSTEILREWSMNYSSLFRYLEVSERNKTLKGKKKAIASAIDATDSTLILTTDSDCTIGKDWIRTFVYVYEQSNPVFISGPVRMVAEKSLWGRFQEIEFASLIGSGASAIGLGSPLMCNGANLAYTREAYTSVHGFEGNEQIASGDDEFLMHKMTIAFPGGISFIKNKAAIVETKAAINLNEFIQQRKRWAGKWSHYTVVYVKLVALWVFLFHFTLIAVLLLAFLNQVHWNWIIMLWLTKGIFDYFYLKSVTNFLSNDFKNDTFIVSVLIYPFYVVTFGVLSRFGKYDWKERTERLS